MAKKATAKKKVKKYEHVNCLWGLMCTLSSIDQQRNNVSVFNVISQLNIPENLLNQDKGVNFIHPHEVIVVFRRALPMHLCNNKISVDVKVTLVDPNKNVLDELLSPIIFEAGKRIMRFRIQKHAIHLTTTGDYVYRIEVKQPGKSEFEKINEVPFEVVPVANQNK